MPDRLALLSASVAHLRRLAEWTTPEQLTMPAYPSEWTVAQVFSHLGAGAEITAERLRCGLAGTEMSSDFAPAVWDAWNARTPRAQAADALVVDEDARARLVAVSGTERERFRFAMGPLELDFDGFVGLRLTEHVVHSWDIAVALDRVAGLLDEAVPAVLDSVPMVAGFSGRAVAEDRVVRVRTSAPDEVFDVRLGPDRVTVTPGPAAAEVDLELPAEAFVRLAYGRMDADHCPVPESPLLDELRAAFPGI